MEQTFTKNTDMVVDHTSYMIKKFQITITDSKILFRIWNQEAQDY